MHFFVRRLFRSLIVAMKEYNVVLPIAGHAYVTVEAESSEDAIEKAMEIVTIDNVEEWEALEQFNQGNVCYCPSPWEAEAEPADGDDNDED